MTNQTIHTFLQMYAGSIFRMSAVQLLTLYEAWRSMDQEEYKKFMLEFEKTLR